MRYEKGVLHLELKCLEKFKTQKEKLQVLNTIFAMYFFWLLTIAFSFGWITNSLTFIIITLAMRKALKEVSK